MLNFFCQIVEVVIEIKATTVAINPKYIIKNVNKLDGIFVKSQFHGHATYQYTGKNNKIGDIICTNWKYK